MIIVVPLFWKSSVLKMISVHTISVDSKPNRKNKSAVSNFSNRKIHSEISEAIKTPSKWGPGGLHQNSSSRQ